MRPPNYPSEKLEREHTTKEVTCKSAMREAGIDETLLAKKLKELLEAKRPWWNPKKQAFDLFPDHRARLAALRLAFKILGSDPAEREDNELLDQHVVECRKGCVTQLERLQRMRLLQSSVLPVGTLVPLPALWHFNGARILAPRNQQTEQAIKPSRPERQLVRFAKTKACYCQCSAAFGSILTRDVYGAIGSHYS